MNEQNVYNNEFEFEKKIDNSIFKNRNDIGSMFKKNEELSATELNKLYEKSQDLISNSNSLTGEVDSPTDIVRSEDVPKLCDCYNENVKVDTNGVNLCCNCGAEVSNVVDNLMDYSTYESNFTSRIFIDTFYPHTSLNSISSPPTNYMERLQIWNTIPYREKSLKKTVELISSKCRQGNIPKCVEDDANILYKNIYNCNYETKKKRKKNNHLIHRRNPRLSLIAACIYYACKRKNLNISQKEIEKLFDLPTYKITKGRKAFKMYLGSVKNKSHKYMSNYLDSRKPESYIKPFCKKLNIKDEFVDTALMYAKNATKLNIASEHKPQSIASGCIFLLIKCRNLGLSKKTISKRTKISEVIIGKTYEKLNKFFKIISNSDKVEKKFNEIQEKKQKSVVPEFTQRLEDEIDNIKEKINSKRQKMRLPKKTQKLFDEIQCSIPTKFEFS